MRRFTSLGVALLLFTAQSLARPVNVPFDRAYTVSAVGSTTPVSRFVVGGPPPVLYLDLPAAWGQYSYGSSNWAAGAGTTLFSVSSPGIFESAGEYWLSPTPDAWNAAKSLGDWHVNANYGWWDLVIIYGGGAPVTKATGSTTVNFSVKSTFPGDADLDGSVDTVDFNSLASNFGGDGKFWQDGDFDFNGSVDTLDFNSLATNFAQTQSAQAAAGAPGVAVPEPSALAAASIACLVLWRHRRATP